MVLGSAREKQEESVTAEHDANDDLQRHRNIAARIIPRARPRFPVSRGALP